MEENDEQVIHGLLYGHKGSLFSCTIDGNLFSTVAVHQWTQSAGKKVFPYSSRN